MNSAEKICNNIYRLQIIPIFYENKIQNYDHN